MAQSSSGPTDLSEVTEDTPAAIAVGPTALFESDLHFAGSYGNWSSIAEAETSAQLITTVNDAISNPSPVCAIIDIPEVLEIGSSFQYNFFVPDETVSELGDTIALDPTDGMTVISEFENLTDTPRYVVVSFDAAAFTDSSSEPDSKKPGEFGILENYSSIIFEGAASNRNYTGVSIQDSEGDMTIYNVLSSSIEILDSSISSDSFAVSVTGSRQDSAKTLIENISTTGMSETNKSEFLSVLTNLKAEGYFVSETNVSEEVVSTAFNYLRNTSYNGTINNRFIGSLISAASKNKANIFSEELSGLKTISSFYQSEAVARSNPGIINEADYAPYVGNPVSFVPDSEDPAPYPRLLGYIVHKRRVYPDGTIVDYDPIELIGENNRVLVDKQVAYEGVYQYTARAIAAVEIEAVAIDDTGMGPDQPGVATILLGSRQSPMTVVRCIENIPPPPPPELNFMYDFSTKHLNLCWDMPHTTQLDIKKFQIFRRESLSDPYTLVREIDFNNAVSKIPSPSTPESLILYADQPVLLFVDEDYDTAKSYYYAIASVDAHGLESNYSQQFSVVFDIFKNNIVTKRISKSGAPRPYPNLYLDNEVFLDTMKDSGHGSCKVYFDPEFLKVYDSETGDLNVLKMDPNNFTYKISFINTEFQSQKIFNIKIVDKREDELQVESTGGARLRGIYDSFG